MRVISFDDFRASRIGLRPGVPRSLAQKNGALEVGELFAGLFVCLGWFFFSSIDSIDGKCRGEA